MHSNPLAAQVGRFLVHQAETAAIRTTIGLACCASTNP